MTRTFLAALVALMLSSGPVAAAEVTGNVLLEKCREFEKLEAGRPNAKQVSAGYCQGFINGVWVTQPFIDNSFRSCAPAGARLGQVVGIVTKFLKENPTQLHKSALVVVQAALAIAWPCN